MREFVSVDVRAHHELFHAGRADAETEAAKESANSRRGHHRFLRNVRDVPFKACSLEHRVCDLFDGERRIVTAVVKLDAVGVFILGHGKHHVGEILHINAGLDCVLAASVSEFVTLETLVQTSHIAVFTRTKYNSRAHDGKPAVFIFRSPFAMDFFGHQFRNAVGRVGRGKSLFAFQVFCGTVRGDAAGKNDVFDTVLAGEIADIFCTANVRLEIGMVRVSRRAVNCGKVED